MKALKSTVSGTVFEVLVAPGSTVAVDQDVVLIESMKMEIPVCAEVAGVIDSVLVAKGDAVTEGQVLVTLA